MRQSIKVEKPIFTHEKTKILSSYFVIFNNILFYTLTEKTMMIGWCRCAGSHVKIWCYWWSSGLCTECIRWEFSAMIHAIRKPIMSSTWITGFHAESLSFYNIKKRWKCPYLHFLRDSARKKKKRKKNGAKTRKHKTRVDFLVLLAEGLSLHRKIDRQKLRG